MKSYFPGFSVKAGCFLVSTINTKFVTTASGGNKDCKVVLSRAKTYAS